MRINVVFPGKAMCVFFRVFVVVPPGVTSRKSDLVIGSTGNTHVFTCLFPVQALHLRPPDSPPLTRNWQWNVLRGMERVLEGDKFPRRYTVGDITIKGKNSWYLRTE